MTKTTQVRQNVFSISGAFAYFIAIFFIAKEVAKFPAYFLAEKALEGTELRGDFFASLLEPKIKMSLSIFGSGSISPLQFALFIPLVLIFLVRFYFHSEALERRYTDRDASIEPTMQYFLRIVWVFTALNIPNLISMFSSHTDAMLLVRWFLVSLLLMYTSISVWHILCRGKWIEETNHSRLKTGNFGSYLTLGDGMPILVIVIALGFTFIFKSLVAGFIAMMVSILAGFIAVSVLILIYVRVELKLIFVLSLGLYLIGFLSQTTIGAQWFQSMLNWFQL